MNRMTNVYIAAALGLMAGKLSAETAAPSDANVWAENCKHVARYSHELIFSVRLVAPKGTATNREDLIDILSSINVNKAPKLKAKQSSLIAEVNKAPKFADNFGKSNMTISAPLSSHIDEFLAAVSSESEKNGAPCR